MELLPNQAEPNAFEFDHYRNEVQLKLNKEVRDLKQRIDILKQSKRQNRDIMITTYEKMVDRKERFIKSWSMSEVTY